MQDDRYVESVVEQIKKAQREREELLEQNKKLARYMHSSNKQVPAFTVKVIKELQEMKKGDDVTEEQIKEINDLIENLEKMVERRRAVINEYVVYNKEIQKTGFSLIDSANFYLSVEARKVNVEMDLAIDNESVKKLCSLANEINLNSMLCDLGFNAIIAAQGAERRVVKMVYGSENGAPFVGVWDIGEPFDKRVIACLGKKEFTTRKEEGGSGIGLFNVFDLMKRYGASFCLNEKVPYDTFKKEVRVTFDGKNEVKILTDREDVKKICAARDFLTE